MDREGVLTPFVLSTLRLAAPGIRQLLFLPLSLPSFQGSLKWALHTVLDRMANVAPGQCLGPIQLFPASHGLFFEAMYVLLFPTHSHHKNV